MSKFLKYLEELNENSSDGLSFSQALYTGKKYLTCTRRNGETVTFDKDADNLHELTTLHDTEFNTNNWSVSDQEQEDNDYE